MMQPYTGSAQFEELKGLAGTWTGTHKMGEEDPTEATVTYQVTSNGSVVMETIFPGTPHEMVSIYHDQGDSVAMTHYCAFGNQPKFGLVSSTDRELNFEFSADNTLDPTTAGHMHALKISLEGENEIEHNWVMFQDGKETFQTVFKLTKN
jgi:hypothetical protein